jgi:adenine/guanine/hypoxanthine permease
LFLTPLVGVIPSYATSPALILVGALMLTNVGQIEWSKPEIAIPAFLTLATIPLTWSIADGLSFGLLSYATLHLLSGKVGRADLRRNWLLYVLAVLFLLRFIYLAQ